MSRPAIPTQVGKLLLLLASDQPGEVVAAARAICRTLASAKLDLNDLAAVIPTRAGELSLYPSRDNVQTAPNVFDMARACRDFDFGRLDIIEKRFVGEMCRLGNRQPTARQAAWLSRLYVKLTRRAA